MKKLFLLALFSIFVISNAYGALISINPLSDDADISNLNKWLTTLRNEMNGSLDDANIKNDSLKEADMADEINPRVRWDEVFNDMTVSGMLPATSAGSLTSDISAGTSYVYGYRIVTSATSATYTASKDTWVYIDINGTFQFSKVANGGAQPTTPSNSLLLAKVVTNAGAITSVSDLRVTSISISGQEDFTLTGMTLSSENDELSVDIGVCYVGTTRVGKTTQIGLQRWDNNDWADGSADTYAGGEGWCYVGVKSTGDIKLLGNNPPNRTTSTGGTVGRLVYYYDGSVYWRVLGERRVNTANRFVDAFQRNDKIMWAVPINITAVLSLGAWSGATSCLAAIPPTSTMGIFGLLVQDTDDACLVLIRPHGGSAWSTNSENGVGFESGSAGVQFGPTGQRICATDNSQNINYYNHASDSATEITVEGYISNLR